LAVQHGCGALSQPAKWANEDLHENKGEHREEKAENQGDREERSQ
jgi:hypothetical protein